VTLKLVAKYANASNYGNGDAGIIRQKSEVLKRHCEAVGRDYDSIIKSTEIPIFPLESGADRARATAATEQLLGMSSAEFATEFWVGTSEEIAERLRPAIDAGIDYVIFYIPRIAYDHGPLQQLAEEVISQFAEGADVG